MNAHVVRVAGTTPPARGEKLGSALGGHEFKVCTKVSSRDRFLERNLLTLRVAAVPEVVLLTISGTEDVVAGQVGSDDQDGVDRTELDLVKDQVPGLEGVDEGNPSEVADCEHEAKTVRDDIHRGEDGRLWTCLEGNAAT